MTQATSWWDIVVSVAGRAVTLTRSYPRDTTTAEIAARVASELTERYGEDVASDAVRVDAALHVPARGGRWR